MTRPAGDDPERDAWLSEALRHAPDAQRLPPAELSATILREARVAVQAARTRAAPGPRVSGRFASAWAWLGRPPVATGFASMMVALLVGLLWWDRPIDEGLRPPPAPPSAATRIAPPARQADRSAAPAAAQSVEAASTTQPTSKAAAEPGQRAQAPARERPRPAQNAAPAARSAPPAPSRDDRASTAAPPTPPRDETPAEPASNVADARRDAAPAASAERSVAAGADTRATMRSESAAANRGALAAKAAASAAAPLAEALASIDAEPQRWSWQLDGRARQPMTPSLARWLHRLDGATAGHWASVAGAGSAAARGVAGALELFRDAAPAYTLHIDATGVRLTPARIDAPAQQATLPTGLANTLRHELTVAAP